MLEQDTETIDETGTDTTEVSEIIKESDDETNYFDFSDSCDFKVKPEDSFRHHIITEQKDNYFDFSDLCDYQAMTEEN